MTILFYEDWELNNYGRWTQYVGTSIQSAVVNTGNYALVSSAINHFVLKQLDAPAPDFFLRFYINLGSLISNATRLLMVSDANGNIQAIWIMPASGMVGNSPFAWQVGKQYRMEVEVKAGNGDGVINVWIDDVLIATYSGMTIGATTTFYLGNTYADVDWTFYLDDIQAGTTPNGPVGSNPLEVSIVPSSATIELGNTATFTANVFGGTPPYSLVWKISKDGVLVNTINATNPLVYQPTAEGMYSVVVTATDTTTSIDSSPATITVTPRIPKTIIISECDNASEWSASYETANGTHSAIVSVDNADFAPESSVASIKCDEPTSDVYWMYLVKQITAVDVLQYPMLSFWVKLSRTNLSNPAATAAINIISVPWTEHRFDITAQPNIWTKVEIDIRQAGIDLRNGGFIRLDYGVNFAPATAWLDRIILTEGGPQTTISGFVKDTNNAPISGATIQYGYVKATSGVDGSFTLSVPQEPDIGLVIYATGYVTTQKIVDASQPVYNLQITLSPTPVNPNCWIRFNNGVTEVYDTNNQKIFQNTDAKIAWEAAFAYVANGGYLTVDTGTYVVTGRSMFMGGDIDSYWHPYLKMQNVTVEFLTGALLTLADGVTQPVWQCWECYDCTIIKPKIDGNGLNQGVTQVVDGIIAWDCSNLLIREPDITNVRQYGVAFGNNNPRPKPCGVINGKISYCGWNGIILSGGGVNSVGNYAYNNEIFKCSDVGISMWEGRRTRIIGNYIHDIDWIYGWEWTPTHEGGSHYGIANEGGSYSIIKDNRVENCPGLGIGSSKVAELATANLIRNNTVVNCGGLGISILDDGFSVVVKNTVENWGVSGFAYGIYLQHWGTTLTNNTIVALNNLIHANTGLVARPIQLDAILDSMVADNTITVPKTATVQGIVVGSQYITQTQTAGSSNNILVRNKIQANYGIWITDAQCLANKIDKNDLTNTTIPLVNDGTGTIIDPASPASYTLMFSNVYDGSGQGKYTYPTGTPIYITLPNGGELCVNGTDITLPANGTHVITLNQDTWAYATAPAIVSLTGQSWTLNVTAQAGGTTTPSGTITVVGSQLVQANPSNGYQFSKWQFDGTDYATTSSVTIPAQAVGSNHTLTAIFAPIPTQKWGLDISVLPTGGGTIEPPYVVGTNLIDEGVGATVTATPNTDYQFSKWTLDGVDVGFTETILVPAQAVASTHSLVAVFTKTPIQAGFPIWALIPVGAIGAWYALKGKKHKRK